MMEYENTKTLDGMLLRELQDDFGFTPVVSRTVLERAKEIMGWGGYRGEEANIGQMKVLVVSSNEPSGKPLTKCKMIPVIVTVDAGEEDREIEREGIDRLRRVIICRISEEAFEQKGLLTENDIARILRCSIRTVKRDIKYLKVQGIFVPLRGDVIGTGRGQSHKVKIAELYLKGATYTEIKRSMHHSHTAIKRYIQMLGRVALCVKQNMSANAISRVLGISEHLTKEYIDLYNRYNIPEYNDRIKLLLSTLTVPSDLKTVKKRGHV